MIPDRTLRTFAALLLAGAASCATSSPAVADDRLASLPRVPELVEIPPLPAWLTGLSFRVVPMVDGGEADLRTAQRAQGCAESFERWMGELGWRAVRSPAMPVDLVIEEHCSPGVLTEQHGSLLEIRHRVEQRVALTVTHDGRAVVTVPRGPAEYVCESRGSPEEIKRDCMARSEKWARAQIATALAGSRELRAVADQLRAGR